MTCESGAFTGRDVVVYFAISCPEVQPTLSQYKRLGMMRGKTTGVEWSFFIKIIEPLVVLRT